MRGSNMNIQVKQQTRISIEIKNAEDLIGIT